MTRTAYFDNAATTFPKPEEVYCFMDAFYRECGVNVGRGQYRLASQAATLVAETRSLLLDLNHCPSKCVVFTHSATEALNIILRGIGIGNGWNVYVSPFEHNAVMRVLHHIGKSIRINVRTLAFDKDTFTYNLNGISEQFAEYKPHLVVVSHASNVCGLIAPIQGIFKVSKKYGAVNVVDMAQTMGLIDTNLNGDTIDYAVFAGHKTLYGPLGIGGFICAPNARPDPLLYGGTGADSANPDLPEFLPERYEVGSPNIAAIAGLNAALKWIQKTGIDNIRNQENANRKRLLEILMQFENVRLLPKDLHTSPLNENSWTGIISCVFDGYSADDVGEILNKRGVAVRTGLHCAPAAHRVLGTFPAGTIRFSVGHFNAATDFTKLGEALNFLWDNA